MSAQGSVVNDWNPKYRVFPYLILAMLTIFLFGLVGYRYLFNDTWLRAFFDTSVTISTLDLAKYDQVETTAQLIFVSIFSLLSGLLFLVIGAYIVTAIIDSYV